MAILSMVMAAIALELSKLDGSEMEDHQHLQIPAVLLEETGTLSMDMRLETMEILITMMDAAQID